MRGFDLDQNARAGDLCALAYGGDRAGGGLGRARAFASPQAIRGGTTACRRRRAGCTDVLRDARPDAAKLAERKRCIGIALGLGRHGFLAALLSGAIDVRSRYWGCVRLGRVCVNDPLLGLNADHDKRNNQGQPSSRKLSGRARSTRCCRR
jgi:hypothetical protein